MPFRLRGSRFLITWSQSDPGHEAIYDILQAYFGDNLVRFIIARELHQDGHAHFHSYVELSRPIDRSLREQLDAGTHPNVQPKRTKPEWVAARDYCRKGTDWIEDGFDDEEAQDSWHSPTLQDLYEEAQGSYIDYLEICHRANIQFAYAKAYWDSAGRPVWTITEDDDWAGTISHPCLHTLYATPDDGRTVVVEGPAGCGKTTWARSRAPKPALWVRHKDDLKGFNPRYHKSIIFDDFDVYHLPRSEQIQLVDVQAECSLHARFSVARIPKGVLRIWTCNPGHFPIKGYFDDEALRRRINYIQLDNEYTPLS